MCFVLGTPFVNGIVLDGLCRLGVRFAGFTIEKGPGESGFAILRKDQLRDLRDPSVCPGDDPLGVRQVATKCCCVAGETAVTCVFHSDHRDSIDVVVSDGVSD